MGDIPNGEKAEVSSCYPALGRLGQEVPEFKPQQSIKCEARLQSLSQGEECSEPLSKVHS